MQGAFAQPASAMSGSLLLHQIFILKSDPELHEPSLAFLDPGSLYPSQLQVSTAHPHLPFVTLGLACY